MRGVVTGFSFRMVKEINRHFFSSLVWCCSCRSRITGDWWWLPCSVWRVTMAACLYGEWQRSLLRRGKSIITLLSGSRQRDGAPGTPWWLVEVMYSAYNSPLQTIITCTWNPCLLRGVKWLSYGVLSSVEGGKADWSGGRVSVSPEPFCAGGGGEEEMAAWNMGVTPNSRLLPPQCPVSTVTPACRGWSAPKLHPDWPQAFISWLPHRTLGLLTR